MLTKGQRSTALPSAPTFSQESAFPLGEASDMHPLLDRKTGREDGDAISTIDAMMSRPQNNFLARKFFSSF